MLRKLLFSMLALCSLFVYGQVTVTKGRVTDEAQVPLPGVSISIKGTTKGVVTDLNGNYSLPVAPDQTMVFSFIGYTPQEITYQGQPTVNIVLLPDNKQLNEIVVIGYQTVKKADLTGAVSTFNTSEMKSRTVTGSVGDALGTLPGLSVRTSGAPGSEGKVEIRGTGTFGSSTPLYVVDGVVSGANRDFNFNDIESIQVLKDASAAAIYGSRAGNGVIIITTKQGKDGKMKIDLSSMLTFQTLPRYELCGRDQWIQLNDLAFTNAGKSVANHFDGNTDWQNEVFKTGLIQEHNISFSGGGKDSKYFISANYQSNSGTTIGSQSKRYTVRSNTSSKRDFGQHLTFRVGENLALSNYSVDELSSTPITQAYRMLPTISVLDPNNAAKGGYGFGDGSRDVTFGTNPIAQEDFEDIRNSNLRARGNVFTELEAFKSLKYRFNIGFDFSSDNHHYLRKEGYWTYNQPYYPSSLNKNKALYQGLVFDNSLEYNKTIGKNEISAVLGISFQTSNYEQIWGTKNGVLMNGSEYFEQLDAALSDPKTGGYQDLEKLFSAFGRVNYTYDSRYLFSFTMRRDESSKFNPDLRVGYFPSVALGWRISNEKFFNVSWVDDLKIRANYGILGASNIGVWDWNSFINVYPQAVFGSNQLVTGMTQVKLANANLKWEELNQMNAGIDAALFKSRLQLSADYFIKQTNDVLTPMQILMVTGNSGGNPYVNAASLTNSGVELSVNWKDKLTKDLTYSIGVNGSYLENKIDKLGYDKTEFTQWDTKSIVGKPIGEWYLIKTDGLFRSAEEVAAYTNTAGVVVQPNAKPGDVKYIDANDDGNITDADRQFCGSTIPKFYLGMNMGLEFKGFDLQLQFAGAFGHMIFNGPRSAFDRFDDNSNYRVNYDPWTPENPNAKDPRPIFGDSRNVRGNQDRWLENGDYLKLKQLALGYSLPKSLLGNNGSSVRLFVNAQNILTFTSYTGLDPEFLNANIWDRSYDGAAFPNPYGLTVGTQITF